MAGSSKEMAQNLRTLLGGHSVKPNVIAEGVEPDEHVAFRALAGFDEAQAYRATHPLAAGHLAVFMNAMQRTTAPQA